MTEKDERVIKENVKDRLIEDEMKESYLDYSMSVIVGRALPDVKDGFKPVHRRILYAMHDMGMHHNKPYKKCARIVGEVLGKYHPHGDTAVYDSLVRMVQDFSLRYPLINGQGNFGSIDGDNAAAMRYTEARMHRISEDMIADIEKKTVSFKPNFDGSLDEPTVLPSKLPNLLLNGSSGIAVGMATNIPPHNLREVSNGIIATIENPDITIEELMEHVKGPDFPTGAMILGRPGIIQAYTTGKGSIRIRGKTEVVKRAGDKERIIINELPYQVNKARLIESIANLAREKKIRGITNIRDESNKDGMRIIIDVSKGNPAEIVLNNLYKQTQLQNSFGITFLSLVDNVPKILNLKEMIIEFIKHRKNVVTKRTKFELEKAKDRAHILEGLIIALNRIDKVIKTIKASKTVEVARKNLVSEFKLTEKQATAILEMKLQKLASLEQEKVRNEHTELMRVIEKLSGILADENKIYGIIKEETEEMTKKYGDDRRTDIIESGECIEDLEDERLIKEEDVVITFSNDDYVKRIPLEVYKQQRRGGKGIIGAKTKEGDIVKEMYVTSTHDYLLCFTNKGKVHWLKAYKIPEVGRYAKGRPIINLLNVEKDEKVKDIIPVKEFKEDNYIFFVTKKGQVKKTPLMAYSKPRSSGIRAITLRDGDDLVEAKLTDGSHEIIIGTRKGFAIRFREKDVRSMGRTASGVRGIRLRKGDNVVGMCRVDTTSSLFTVSEKGYGKRTKFENYRIQTRGGKGITNLKVRAKNGEVIGIVPLQDNDEIMFISREGMIIRTIAKYISEIGRATQGVRVMRLNQGDKLVSFAKIKQEDIEEPEDRE